MRFQGILARIALLVLVFASTGMVIPTGEAQTVPSRTPRPPILIEKDLDFHPGNGVVGGTGTPSDPYIIRGWAIEFSNPADVAVPGLRIPAGIHISGTTKHFVVENCLVREGTTHANGLQLVDAANGRVLGFESERNLIGIATDEADNVVIEDARIRDSFGPGIQIGSSRNVTINRSDVSDSLAEGFAFIEAQDVRVEASSATRSGEVEQPEAAGFAFKDSQRVQMLSVGAENTFGVGISIVDVADLRVEGAQVRNSTAHGVAVTGNPVTLAGLVVEHHPKGMGVYLKGESHILRDSIVRGATAGVYIEGSRNRVLNNTILNQSGSPGHGIFVLGDDNELVGNQLLNNEGAGLYIGPGSRNNRVEDNRGFGNRAGDIVVAGSDKDNAVGENQAEVRYLYGPESSGVGATILVAAILLACFAFRRPA